MRFYIAKEKASSIQCEHCGQDECDLVELECSGCGTPTGILVCSEDTSEAYCAYCE